MKTDQYLVCAFLCAFPMNKSAFVMVMATLSGTHSFSSDPESHTRLGSTSFLAEGLLVSHECCNGASAGCDLQASHSHCYQVAHLIRLVGWLKYVKSFFFCRNSGLVAMAAFAPLLSHWNDRVWPHNLIIFNNHKYT